VAGVVKIVPSGCLQASLGAFGYIASISVAGCVMGRLSHVVGGEGTVVLGAASAAGAQYELSQARRRASPRAAAGSVQALLIACPDVGMSRLT